MKKITLKNSFFNRDSIFFVSDLLRRFYTHFSLQAQKTWQNQYIYFFFGEEKGIFPTIICVTNGNNTIFNKLSMSFQKKAFIFSLLIFAFLSQSVNLQNTTYTVQGQTYLRTYGSGPASSNSLGERNLSQPSIVGTQVNSYNPPSSGPKPVTITCPYNQVYDNILCQCVCIIGYHFEGSNCVPNGIIQVTCGPRQVYQDSRCVCAQGFYLIGQICDVCPLYATYDLGSRSCFCASGYVVFNNTCVQPYIPPEPKPGPTSPNCSINQKLDNNICICLDGFYLIKGVCTYCAAPNYYDTQFAICRPTCKQNQNFDLNSNICICQSGFFNIRGKCGICQPYSVYNKNSKTCDCIQGYTQNNGNCIPSTRPPVIPQPPLPPGNNCGPNMIFVNQQCICNKGFNLISGVCQACPDGTYFDVQLQICRVPCLVNQVYNPVNNTCGCAKTYYNISGFCQQCPGNTTFSDSTQSCGCPSGFKNQGGYCVVGCGPNQILSNGQCCCITGYYPVKGICSQCQWNQVYDQGLGICRIPCGAKRIFDISSQSCVCLPQYFQMADGTCGICTLHSTYSSVTQQCVCDSGYVLSLGLCITACNPYEVFVNGNCVCRDGYYLIGYSCGICPPTQIYDSTYRICRMGCKTNEVWDPLIRACRCLPAYYLVGGVCSQCNSTNQVYNQKLQCCDCIAGYRKVSGQGCNGVCVSNCNQNQNWIQGRCVCKPGYYLINNFCTQCPTGQFYDIYQRLCRNQCGTNQVYNFNSGKCDCAQGFYIVQGACSKCLYGEVYNEYTQICSIIPCQGVNQFYSNITQQCVCKSQYVRIRGVCTNCPPGYYYDSYSDRCLCKPGFKQIGGFCQPICPLDQNYVNGKCQCKNGQKIINGICKSFNRCPLNSHLDIKTDCCVCNQGFSVINGKCSDYQYCGVNGYLKYGQCYCNDGFYWILGSCQACGENQAYNGVVCECLVGYLRDINGNCIKSNFNPTCYNNQRFDTTLQACVCVDGTQYVRGICQTIPKCPQNSYYDGLQCVCNSGYIAQNGQCIVVDTNIPTCPANSFFNGVSCTCNTGFYQSDLNACAPCPDGTTFDGNACGPSNTCAAGFIFNEVSNQCEPAGSSCGANSYWNGVECVCTSGAHLINNICQRCSKGTYFDGLQCSSSTRCKTKITCDTNQIAVNGACVCSAGFYNIKGKCLACPINTKWNGKYCVCSGSDASKWCFGKPYTIFSSGSCKCQQNYYSINGLCSKTN